MRLKQTIHRSLFHYLGKRSEETKPKPNLPCCHTGFWEAGVVTIKCRPQAEDRASHLTVWVSQCDSSGVMGICFLEENQKRKSAEDRRGGVCSAMSCGLPVSHWEHFSQLQSRSQGIEVSVLLGGIFGICFLPKRNEMRSYRRHNLNSCI